MPTLKKHTETQLVKACLEWLHLHGIVAWRQNTGAVLAAGKGKRRLVRFGIIGMADIGGVLPDGRALHIECKLPGRYTSFDQDEFLDSINENGGLGIVVHTLDELQQKLRVEPGTGKWSAETKR